MCASRNRKDSMVRRFAVAGFIFSVLLFWIFKAYSWFPSPGDEFIYVYQGFMVSIGRIPYRDFFMAHPPVQSAVTGLVLFLVQGFNYTLARMLPWIWTTAAATGLFVLLWDRRRYAGAAVAVFMFLSGYDLLRASSHLTGVNQAVCFMIWAAVLMGRNRPVVGGILCALALQTRFYVLPGVAALMLGALFFFPERRGVNFFFKAALSCAAAFIFVLLVSILVAGWEPVYTQVFKYHWSKPPMKGGSLDSIWRRVLYNNFSLYMGGLTAAAGLFFRTLDGFIRKKGFPEHAGFLFTAVIAAGLQLGILGVVDRVWMFYFYPAYPFLAVLTAWVLVSGGSALIRVGGSVFRSEIRKTVKASAGPLFALMFFVIGWAWHVEWQGGNEATEKKYLKTYQFKEAPVPDFVNGAVRSLFWVDDRYDATFYNVWTLYLWHESRVFDQVFKAAKMLKEKCGPDDALFGDSGSAPLLSLLSGCRLAADESDTNILRFRSGLTNPDEFISRVEKDGLRFMLLRPRFGVAALPQVVNLQRSDFGLLGVFQREGAARYYLFEKKPGI